MNARPLSILFTSAGRRVELIECFARAGRQLGRGMTTHACDLYPDLSAACHYADHSARVPRCDAPEYVDILLDYCTQYDIDLLIPTIDPELYPLAFAKERFAAAGTKVHVSEPETIEIVRDKARTIEVLQRGGVPVPRTGKVREVKRTPHDWEWPAFIKPSGGSASRGIAVLEDANAIAEHYDEPMIVQQLLDGDEYTVNIFVDEQGKLRTAIPHKRLSVRAGEVEKGITVRRADIQEIAEKLVDALPGGEGAMCFQLIDDKRHGPRVFEINARFGGGYPLADKAGGRFAERLLVGIDQPGLAEPPSWQESDWKEGVTMLRYDAAVFL
ncbi:ATP-grasp domain-containing protein [Erythrobacter sp.]|jgi:carbamoyl-phosphate synthase large subunit|uniref:ATP-grasp domain-containing protein n=1 Tax=Erythrobacter sp. TaxID=1042 RepID=UPI002EC4B56E|nr:ATP-grasp domain-containing protein [Erythrobacter sp.]